MKEPNFGNVMWGQYMEDNYSFMLAINQHKNCFGFNFPQRPTMNKMTFGHCN